MSLAYPYLLFLLPLPLLVRYYLGRKEAVDVSFAVPSETFRVAIPSSMRGNPGGIILLVCAWVSLVAALAGPRVSIASDVVVSSGREIILALDLSGSMVNEDFILDGKPVSRLDAVKRVASAFIAARKGDRIGVVIFGDRAYVAQAPTFDVNSVAKTVENAQIGISGLSTSIADGIGLAIRAFDKSDVKTKIIILLSDGIDDASKVKPIDAAQLAARHGIRIHTIALGPDDLESKPGDRDAVDAVTLRAIADAGGGLNFRVRTLNDLFAMASTFDELEPSQMRRPPTRYWNELWVWPAAAALIFVCLLAVRRQI